jgi:nicotinamidase-related amidase
MKLRREDAVLVVIDIQEKLLPVIHGGEAVVRNVDRLIRGCHILGVPAIVTEQYVRGLGPTVEPLRRAFDETGMAPAIEKDCFSAEGCERFASGLSALGRRQVLVAGVETHVCVYQTVSDLLSKGYEITVIADAVSSRTAENKEIALRRMTQDGAKISSTEMALFELTVVSGTDEFRAISKLIR